MCVYSFSRFGAGITPVWMNRVQCNGTEASLKNCGFPGFGVVPLRFRVDLFAAGVVCFSKYMCVCTCASVCECAHACVCHNKLL